MSIRGIWWRNGHIYTHLLWMVAIGVSIKIRNTRMSNLMEIKCTFIINKVCVALISDMTPTVGRFAHRTMFFICGARARQEEGWRPIVSKIEVNSFRFHSISAVIVVELWKCLRYSCTNSYHSAEKRSDFWCATLQIHLSEAIKMRRFIQRCLCFTTLSNIQCRWVDMVSQWCSRLFFFVSLPPLSSSVRYFLLHSQHAIMCCVFMVWNVRTFYISCERPSISIHQLCVCIRHSLALVPNRFACVCVCGSGECEKLRTCSTCQAAYTCWTFVE